MVFVDTSKPKTTYFALLKVAAVFVDIEQAFDKVWHTGLLYKLDKLRIPCYIGKRLTSYLEGKTFSVRLHGTLSEAKEMETGVPQGCVLETLLFNILLYILFNTSRKPKVIPN